MGRGWLPVSRCDCLDFERQKLPAEGPVVAPHYAYCKQQAPGTVGLRQRIVKEQSNIGGAPIQIQSSRISAWSQQKMTPRNKIPSVIDDSAFVMESITV